MVTRFKHALGIHSPSRVFKKLGGYVIAGLTKGLKEEILKALVKKYLKTLVAEYLIQWIKSKLTFQGGLFIYGWCFGGSGGVEEFAGAGVQQWTGVAF